MVTRDPEGVCMTPTIVNGKRNGVFWGNEMVHYGPPKWCILIMTKFGCRFEIDYSVIPMSGIRRDEGVLPGRWIGY
ncbi:MAG: hypothetical protein LKF56_00860 [Prevotella sp.]|nr:hypothetical protein [Prevotella sp.]MCI1370957.1 hypothetical protein [Prevotella sp.]MCI2180386.1 hypothetical protein [Prevotella sp.]